MPMNLDELLNSVMAVEQQIHAPSSSSSTSIAQLLPGNYNMNTLSRKTVYEVWREIIQQGEQGSTERPAKLGETTLEDFLVRAGAMNMGSHGCGVAEGDSQALLSVDPLEQEEWLQYQLAAAQQQQQHMAIPGSGFSVLGNSISNAGFNENQQMGLPMVSMTMARSVVTRWSSSKHTCL